MEFYLIGVLCVILIISLCALLLSLRRGRQKRELKTLSETDFENGVRSLMRENRYIERGSGIRLQAVNARLNRANRLISAKVKADRPLTEGEKWYYENVGFVKRFADNFASLAFVRLPRSKNGVRIITLARYIVQNSLSALDYGRICLAVEAANKEASLTYEELVSLKSAIGFALVEAIYVLAARLIHFSLAERRAASGKLNEKYLTSDIYLHFALKTAAKSAVRERLDKLGIDADNVTLNYSKSVVQTTEMARYLFENLKNLDNLMNGEQTLALLTPNKVLAKCGSYADMSFATRNAYLTEISVISERTNLSETLIARKLAVFSEYNGLDAGVILFEHKRDFVRYVYNPSNLRRVKARTKRAAQCAYIFATILIAVGLCIGGYFLSGSVFAAVAAALPIFLVAEKLLNFILSFFEGRRPLPQMDYGAIPAEHATLVVVSEFITSQKQMEEAIDRLRVLRAGSRDCGKNVSIALLADFKASDSQIHADDNALIEAAKAAEGEDNIYVFVRKRKKIGKRYAAHERKRGAICALVRALVGGDWSEFEYLSKSNVPNFNYMLTLDADNVVNVGGINGIINTIAHPANDKYDLISIRSKYNTYSLKTPYASFVARDNGYESYPNYSGLYMGLFGVDMFCGKGIFRIKRFFAKLENVFPDNKILSHDILEGAVLSTASDGVVYEDAPANFVADAERKRRWQRGDIQLIPFSGRRWRNNDGEEYSSEVAPIYKFLIWRNVIAILAPILLFVLGALSAVYLRVFYLFAAVIAAPLAIELFSELRTAVLQRHRPRYVIKDILRDIAGFFVELGLIPYYTLNSIVTFTVTACRMLGKKNLLEWKTYRQSQTDSGKFWAEVAPSMLLVPVVFFVFYGANVILSLPLAVYAVFSYLIYAALFVGGLKKKPKAKIGVKNLRDYAERTYAYFKYMRREGALIADNLQIKPYKGMSPTTSPTNIGFQLLSEISAYFLNFCSLEETVRTLEQITAQIEGLKKWRGNLYNWYHTDSKNVAIDFVSGVDSGNLVAALYAVYGFCKLKSVGGTLAQRVKLLIENTELDALYDKSRELFYIGYNVKTKRYEGHYDLLASESRLLSLVSACSNGGKNWIALQRDFSPLLGNTLFSWNGTAFEYLMADIFVLPPKKSLLGTTSKNAVTLQSYKKTLGVFGLSESGYYAFDDGLRYQYRAFGLDALALGRDKEKRVISPYASILGLHYAPKKVVENLVRLAKIGCLSDYGFYEAIDLKDTPRRLYSYMTHHQGMSLTAICNYLTDGKLRDCFMFSEVTRAAGILLTERQEKRVFGYKMVEKQPKEFKTPLEYSKLKANLEYSTFGCGLTDGQISVYCEPMGGGYTSFGGRLCNRYFASSEASARAFYVKNNGRLASPSRLYSETEGDFTFAYTPTSASYTGADGVRLDIAVDANLSAEICKLTFNKRDEDTLVGFYEPLSLNDYAGGNAHPAFNALFVETDYIADYKMLVAKRRVKKGEQPYFVGLIIRGLRDVRIVSDRFKFIGRCGSAKSPAVMYKDFVAEIDVGEQIEPCFGFVGSPVSNEIEVVRISADSRDALIKKAGDIPKNYYAFAQEVGGNVRLQALTNALLYPLTALPYPNMLLEGVGAGKRFEFMSLTQGKRAIVYDFDENAAFDGFIRLLESCKELRYFGLKPRVIAVFSSAVDGAYRKSAERLAEKSFFDVSLIDKADLGFEMSEIAFILLDKRLNLSDTYSVKRLSDEFNSVAKIGEAGASYDYKSGNGGFVKAEFGNVYMLPLNKNTGLPYSNVVCGERGGFVATERGGGFVYFGNSHENTATMFCNDPVSDIPKEQVCAKVYGATYRINGGAGVTDTVAVCKGRSVYYSTFADCSATVEYYIVNDGAIKITEVNVNKAEAGRLKLSYAFEGMLGASKDVPFVYCERLGRNVASMTNLANGQQIYFVLLGGGAANRADLSCANNVVEFTCEAGAGSQLFFAVGLKDDILALKTEDIGTKKRKSLAYFENLNNVKLSTRDKSLDILFNDCLMYQVVSSRLNGKCGYYQVGGATGFRDQLQDTLALMQNDSERVRKQIILHAAHQYVEGDVMHWWHEPYFGLRSRISDDKLFLPYIVAKYVKTTGDKSLLDEEVAYLGGEILGANETARYEAGKVSAEIGSIRQHCIRAIKNALNYGEHNLLLLGSGDWNDGLDYIGEKGRAESVLLTVFACGVIKEFGELCEGSLKSGFDDVMRRLKAAVETFAYDGKQYMRLFGDDGRWYGADNTDAYKIDLACQAMAVMSGVAEGERAQNALDSADSLVDKKHGIIKLLAPPLDENNYLGYISAYPKGVRENGGQYTHAAVWYIIALLRLRRAEEAYSLIKLINPVEKCANSVTNAVYKGEPYVLAGDVYGGAFVGRAGWTWYTGSASWAYYMLLEEFFGVKKRGDRLYFEPVLPKAMDGARLNYRYRDGVIAVTYSEKGAYKLTCDGVDRHDKNYINLNEETPAFVTVEY